MVHSLFFGFIFFVSIFISPGLAISDELIVVTEDFPPYNYRDPQTGEAAGVSTELVRALLKEAGSDSEIKIFPWARAYEMAQRDKNILIYSMKRTLKREFQFKWVAELIKHETFFLAHKDSVISSVSDLSTLKSLRIGAIRGGAVAKSLEYDGFGSLEVVSSREANWEKLKKGRIDLWCTSLLSARHIVNSLGENPEDLKVIYKYPKLSRASLYAAFSDKTDDAVVEKYVKAFERLKEKGIYDRLIKLYGIGQ